MKNHNTLSELWQRAYRQAVCAGVLLLLVRVLLRLDRGNTGVLETVISQSFVPDYMQARFVELLTLCTFSLQLVRYEYTIGLLLQCVRSRCGRRGLAECW